MISALIKEKSIPCVLIGGFAVNHYKVTRQTADVDFLTTRDDYHKISALLRKEGFEEDYAQEVFVRLTTEKPYLMDVDFMFVDKDTLDKIAKKGKQVEIVDQKFIIPCLNHLIALKLHAIKYNPKIREFKDLLDIVDLIKKNRVNVKEKEFKDMCLKYGTPELYNKIVSLSA